jgi:hypothetical protein
MIYFLILWFRIVRFHVYVSICVCFFLACSLSFLDFWKKNEKNKKVFHIVGKVLMRPDLILGWEVEEKQLEAELYYKIVGDGGAIIKNL